MNGESQDINFFLSLENKQFRFDKQEDLPALEEINWALTNINYSGQKLTRIQVRDALFLRNIRHSSHKSYHSNSSIENFQR